MYIVSSNCAITIKIEIKLQGLRFDNIPEQLTDMVQHFVLDDCVVNIVISLIIHITFLTYDVIPKSKIIRYKFHMFKYRFYQ